MPPQRYRIVERGGRLEVIDVLTGARPPSAAERMAAHDAEHGHAALRYDRLTETTEEAAKAAPQPAKPAPVPAARQAAPAPNDTIRAALAKRDNPWGSKNDRARPQLAAQSVAEAEARPRPGGASGRPAPASTRRAGKNSIVTGKWWDAKGPRTITLGERGRSKLSSSIMTLIAIGMAIFIVLAIIQPIMLFVAGFVLFRFGGTFIGPIGARVLDEAIRIDAGGA
jgi:hypothetical protein